MLVVVNVLTELNEFHDNVCNMLVEGVLTELPVLFNLQPMASYLIIFQLNESDVTVTGISSRDGEYVS